MNGNHRAQALESTSAPTRSPVIEKTDHHESQPGESEFSNLLQQLSTGIRKEDVKKFRWLIKRPLATAVRLAGRIKRGRNVALSSGASMQTIHWLVEKTG